ncbi:MAG: MFS transporter, partial [Bacteroidetes bacterium]|nr:MFS transporter [Bacteroidota bacterium]
VIPLILFEFYFYRLAGKIGFKKTFKVGFLIVSVLTLLCFFVGNIYLILLLLILANIGIAMIEPTTEAYFFDILKGKQVLQFYGPYNTTIDVNNFVVKIAASTLLIFLPFKFIFLLFGGFMFIFFLVCFKMREVVEAKK